MEEKLKDEIKSERWYINFDDEDFQRKIRNFLSEMSSTNKQIRKRDLNKNSNSGLFDEPNGTGSMEAIRGSRTHLRRTRSRRSCKNSLNSSSTRNEEDDRREINALEVQKDIVTIWEIKSDSDQSFNEDGKEEEESKPLQEDSLSCPSNRFIKRRRIDEDGTDMNAESGEHWNLKIRTDSSLPLSEKDKNSIAIFKEVINEYFNTLKKMFKVNIPKRVITFLVKESIKDIKNKIQTDLFNSSDITELLKEDEDTTNKRQRIEERIEALKEAQIAIRLVNEFRRSSFDRV